MATTDFEAAEQAVADLWTPPPVLSCAEVFDLPLPNVKPLLGAQDRGPLLWPGSRLVLGGDTGAGKTVFSLRAMRAAVLGEEFLVWRGYGETRGLVLDLEQGLRTVQRRLEETGLWNCKRIDYVRVPDGLTIDSQETQRMWLEGVLADGAYGIVMVDPLYKLHDGDPNDERMVVNLMRHLDRWREQMNFGLVLPAHLRKADKVGRANLSISDISGSGAIVRGAEVVLGIKLMSGMPEGGEGYGKSKLHFWKDRDGDLPVGRTWDLKFKPEEGFSIDESAKLSNTDRLRELLARMWPAKMALDDMADRLGLAKKTVERHLKTIQGEGTEVVKTTGPHGVLLYGLAEVYDEDMEDEF